MFKKIPYIVILAVAPGKIGFPTFTTQKVCLAVKPISLKGNFLGYFTIGARVLNADFWLKLLGTDELRPT